MTIRIPFKPRLITQHMTADWGYYRDRIRALGGTEYSSGGVATTNKAAHRGARSETRRYLYLDNHSKVLAVAHLDTVLEAAAYLPLWTVDMKRVYHPSNDDRMGAYVLLDILPKLGMRFDILLTDDEETGRSTADMFVPPTDRQYNWMFQFDRHGEDVVLYQYESPELRAALLDCKFEIGIGSFSDICSLSSLGCGGFNVGTGYHNEHSTHCYTDLRTLERQLRRFMVFAGRYQDVQMPKGTGRALITYGGYGGHNLTKHGYDDADYERWWKERESSAKKQWKYTECEWCGDKKMVDKVSRICAECDAEYGAVIEGWKTGGRGQGV